MAVVPGRPHIVHLQRLLLGIREQRLGLGIRHEIAGRLGDRQLLGHFRRDDVFQEVGGDLGVAAVFDQARRLHPDDALLEAVLGLGHDRLDVVVALHAQRRGGVGAAADQRPERSVDQALLGDRQVGDDGAGVLEGGAQHLAHLIECGLVERDIGVDAGIERQRHDRPVTPVEQADLVLVGGVEHRRVARPGLQLVELGVDGRSDPAPAGRQAGCLAFELQRRERRAELRVEFCVLVGEILVVDVAADTGRPHARDPRAVG